jgi:hypothetical protein
VYIGNTVFESVIYVFKMVVMPELVWHGFSTHGLPGCIMRPAVTFVNYVLEKLRSNLGGLVYHLFSNATREPAHNNECGLSSLKFRRLCCCANNSKFDINVSLTV